MPSLAELLAGAGQSPLGAVGRQPYVAQNPADTLGAIGAPVAQFLAHAAGEPIRKGQGFLQTMRDYSANEFPATMGATAQSTDYDPRREAAGYAAGTAVNTLGAPAAVGGVPGIGIGIGRGRTVRPATDDLYDVANANFRHGMPSGNRTMPIDALSGGAGAGEAARVQELAQKIAHPDGYISRLIVDDAGNVVEGQHRLSALRSLGEKTVPVSVIKDLERGLNADAANVAVRGVGGLHPDQVHGVIRSALEAANEAGGPAKALENYSLPGFQNYFEAALKAMSDSK